MNWDRMEGKGKPQETYGITKEETEKQLADWQQTLKDRE